MADNDNRPDTLVSESVVGLYNRLRNNGAEFPPEAQAIATANRLVEQLLAAIEIWESPGTEEERWYSCALNDEIRRFRQTLAALGDGIAELGGSPRDEPDTVFRDAGVDIDGSTDVAAILSRLRGRLLRACTDVEVNEYVPKAAHAAVHRLALSLRSRVRNSGSEPDST